MGSIRKSTLIAAVLAVAATPSLFATPDPDPATARKASQVTSGGAIEPEMLRLREAAWRAWFASDETALRQMLPPEFLGIDMGNGPFSDLEKTLEESRAGPPGRFPTQAGSTGPGRASRSLRSRRRSGGPSSRRAARPASGAIVRHEIASAIVAAPAA